MTHTVKFSLTHWGRLTHICVSKQTSIGSENGLSPGRRQAIIWTNVGILLIWPLGTNFNEISIEIHILSFKKMHLKMSSGKWRTFCLGLNVLLIKIDNMLPSLLIGVIVLLPATANTTIQINVCPLCLVYCANIKVVYFPLMTDINRYNKSFIVISESLFDTMIPKS